MKSIKQPPGVGKKKTEKKRGKRRGRVKTKRKGVVARDFRSLLSPSLFLPSSPFVPCATTLVARRVPQQRHGRLRKSCLRAVFSGAHGSDHGPTGLRRDELSELAEKQESRRERPTVWDDVHHLGRRWCGWSAAVECLLESALVAPDHDDLVWADVASDLLRLRPSPASDFRASPPPR